MTERDILKKVLNEAFIKSDDNFGMPNIDQVADYLMDIAEALYSAGYRKQSENTVEVVRCKDCRYLGRKDDDTYLKQCERCGDINEPCGYCVMFGCCTNKNGYCYLGERSKE